MSEDNYASRTGYNLHICNRLDAKLVFCQSRPVLYAVNSQVEKGLDRLE